MDHIVKNIGKLGFGMLRPPRLSDDSVDIETLKEMVDIFIENGFNYFDTAYVYLNGDSERALKEALVDRYPREKFYLADKFSAWAVEKPEQMQEIFNTSLERTGAEYFDFYLIHNLGDERTQMYEDLGAWEFVKGLKEKGLVKHIGFSIHDTADKLEEILIKHPEAEFVQLQINYGDWENVTVQSRLCYETALKYNKPIMIMEPVKGGSLTTFSDEIKSVFLEADPNSSVASWAIRFAASLDNIVTVLSGMSNIEQVRDNVEIMKNFKPLDASEYEVIKKVSNMLAEISTVPCTDCRYCVDDCPGKVKIPVVFSILNQYKMYSNYDVLKRNYAFETMEGRASQCIECGQCEKSCPQHIKIVNNLKEAAELFE